LVSFFLYLIFLYSIQLLCVSNIKPQSVNLSAPLIPTKQPTNELDANETEEELINRLRNHNLKNRRVAKRKPKRDKVG
jgi:hypothetical protein